MHISPTPQSAGVPEVAIHPGLAQSIQIVNANHALGEGSEVVLTIDEATRRSLVQIVDSESGEVISQVPYATIFQLANKILAAVKQNPATQ